MPRSIDKTTRPIRKHLLFVVILIIALISLALKVWGE
jgi:hypothetical protein